MFESKIDERVDAAISLGTIRLRWSHYSLVISGRRGIRMCRYVHPVVVCLGAAFLRRWNSRKHRMTRVHSGVFEFVNLQGLRPEGQLLCLDQPCRAQRFSGPEQ
jgi:hypothetical protein